MNQLLAVLGFALCISMAFALRCNVCNSLKSLADCDKNKKELDCGPTLDRCATLTVRFKVQEVETASFTRTCNTKAHCSNTALALQQCKDAGGECKLECCDTDLCNPDAAQGTRAPTTAVVDATTTMKDSAGHTVVSVLLMVACVVGLFFH